MLLHGCRRYPDQAPAGAEVRKGAAADHVADRLGRATPSRGEALGREGASDDFRHQAASRMVSGQVTPP
jgi:hypothetical protein